MRLKVFCIEMAVKLMAVSLFFKLELFLSGPCETSRLKTAAKMLLNLSSSLIKADYIREMFENAVKTFVLNFRLTQNW